MNWTICAVWLSQAIFKPSFIQPRFTRSSFLARPCFTLIKFHSFTPGICQLLTVGLYTQQLHWTVAPSRTQLWLFFKQRKAILINFASQIWQNDLSVLIILSSPLSNVTLILSHRSNDAVREDVTRCILRPHYFQFSCFNFNEIEKITWLKKPKSIKKSCSGYGCCYGCELCQRVESEWWSISNLELLLQLETNRLTIVVQLK